MIDRKQGFRVAILLLVVRAIQGRLAACPIFRGKIIRGLSSRIARQRLSNAG